MRRLVKCLHAGVTLYIAGGETVLTSGVAYTLADGQGGIHPSCISAVYDAFTGNDVTDTIVQSSSRPQVTPMDVSTAETTPDNVPRVTVHTKEELLNTLLLPWRPHRRLDRSATEATSMSDDGADHTASASCPGRTHWYFRTLMLGRKPCKLMTVPRSKGC